MKKGGERNMNKNTLLVIGIVVVMVIVGGILVANQQSQKAQEAKMAQEKAAMVSKDKAMDGGKDEAMQKNEDTMTNKENTMTDDKTNTNRYVLYSKATFENAAKNRRVLFFYANWCPTCQPADADFKTNANKIPSDVTVIRVNYNDTDTDQEEKALAQQYGVTYQHTFVQVDANGKEVTKWNGGKMDELLNAIK